MEQWITLLSDLPPKLVTSSLVIIVALVLPHAGQPKSSSWHGKCTLGINYVLSLRGSLSENNKQHCYIVISFFCFKVKWIAKAAAQIIAQWFLHYNDACIEPRITFEYFHVCFRSKHSKSFSGYQARGRRVEYHGHLNWGTWWQFAS